MWTNPHAHLRKDIHIWTGPSQGSVLWKDILTGVWNGPDPVLAWARGAVCVFPQTHQDPICVPEQLVRKINQPPKDNDFNTYDEPPDDTHGDEDAPMGNNVCLS